MAPFSARIRIIGVNPYVALPRRVLKEIFRQAKRERGPIPVRGTFNGAPFQQTLVRYQGAWRLYTNLTMLKAAGKLWVGDTGAFRIAFDPKPPAYPMPRALSTALAKNPQARAAFKKLTPGRQKEINRYVGSLKSQVSVERNVAIVVRHLVGSRKPKTLRALMHRPAAHRKSRPAPAKGESPDVR